MREDGPRIGSAYSPDFTMQPDAVGSPDPVLVEGEPTVMNPEQTRVEALAFDTFQKHIALKEESTQAEVTRLRSAISNARTKFHGAERDRVAIVNRQGNFLRRADRQGALPKDLSYEAVVLAYAREREALEEFHTLQGCFIQAERQLTSIQEAKRFCDAVVRRFTELGKSVLDVTALCDELFPIEPHP